MRRRGRGVLPGRSGHEVHDKPGRRDSAPRLVQSEWISSLRSRHAGRAVFGQACRLYALGFIAFKFPAIVGGVPPS
jgi:hypothetical protein